MQLRRLATASAVAVLAVLGTLGVANAAPEDPVNTDAVGSLTIHKYETPAGGAGPTAGDGTINSKPTGATPLPGVTFQIQKVNGIDLGNNADWAKAADLVTSLEAAIATSPTAADAWVPGNPYTLGNAQSGITDDPNGELTFDDLEVGLYFVKELSYTGTEYDEASITKAAPFLVTVPMEYPKDSATNANEWNYDVHVFPKNTISEISKTVDDKNTTQVGDEISYTISTSIPTEPITKYVVTDTLPTQAGYKTGSVELRIVTATDPAGTVVPAANYTVTGTANETQGGTVIITLNQDGFDQLQAAKAADSTAMLATKLTAIVLDVGAFKNSAGFYPNDGSSEINIKDGEKPETKVGGQKFKKVNGAGEGLEGATFKIYKTSTPEYKNATEVTETDPLYPRVVVSAGAPNLGEFAVDGLRYSDFANNKQLTCADTVAGTVDDGCIYYWLVETKAPAGYVKLASPVMFQVKNQQSASTEIEIVNVSDDDINGSLPLTGMGGILLLVVAGVLVLGGAGYGMYRISRKAA